jgi:CRP-like cAMP-binding protein
MAIQRLTVAYRSRSRPSSTLGAKASTVCPYYLDGDLAQRDRTSLAERFDLVGPGDTRLFSRRLSMAADVASVQFSRTVERRITSADLAHCGHALWRVPRDSGGRRSLKTQQHAGVVCGRRPTSSRSSAEVESRTAIQPGSVDMLGPIRLVIAMPHTHCWALTGLATARVCLATGPGSGHR